MRRNRDVRDAREREQAQGAAAKLVAAPVQVAARAGEGGKLFGSVTSADIAAAIEAATGVTVDRRKIALDEPLKAVGPADVEVDAAQRRPRHGHRRGRRRADAPTAGTDAARPVTDGRAVSRRSPAAAVVHPGVVTPPGQTAVVDVHSPVDDQAPLSPGNSHRFRGLSTSNPQGRGVTMHRGADGLGKGRRGPVE